MTAARTRLFRVVWTCDIEAANHAEAAHDAMILQRSGTHMKFHVAEKSRVDGVYREIDLAEEDPDAGAGE